jgi:hypothetical protein
MNTVKRFLIHSSLFLGLLACGQNSGPADVDDPVFVQAGTPFQLRPGGSARVGDSGLVIGFRGITGESRCPMDVVCVWQGDATARIQATVGRMAWTGYDLHTGLQPQSIKFQDWTIKLVSVEPYPRSDRQIRPEEYVLTLEVTR